MELAELTQHATAGSNGQRRQWRRFLLRAGLFAFSRPLLRLNAAGVALLADGELGWGDPDAPNDGTQGERLDLALSLTTGEVKTRQPDVRFKVALLRAKV